MKTPSFKFLNIVVIVSFLTCSRVYADATGADLKILSQMYANMVKQLEEMKSQVNELKAANDAVKGVQSGINDLKHEYYFIKNFDPKAEVDSVKFWAKGEIGILDLNGSMSLDEKWSIIDGQLDKRFINNPAAPRSVNDKQLEAIKNLIKQMKKNERELLNYLKEEKAIATTDLKSKELEQRNAAAQAMLARFALENHQKELEAELAKREKLLNQVEHDYSFLQYLGK